MSYLFPPRLYFKGSFFTNVDTANNNDASDFNYVDCRNVRMQLDEVAAGMTPDEFRKWCKSEGLPAGWNPLGDNACWFKDAVVSGCDLGNGLLTDAAVEPLIGARVQIGKAAQKNTGIMVDVDPEGVFGTQIFSDEIRVEKGLVSRIAGQPKTTYSYWLNFSRNWSVGGFSGASAAWHFEVPFDGMMLAVDGSPFLEAVEALKANRRGLVVRFATYLVAPKYESSALAALFAQGQNAENPAQGVVLGSIGVLGDADIGTAPSGRPLFGSAPVSVSHKPIALGPATAVVDQDRQKVVLDLLSTFPEDGIDGAKMNLGPAFLAYVDGNGSPVRVGDIPYDKKTFDACAGVAEVSIPDGMLNEVIEHSLEIGLDKFGVVAKERAARVETPDRGLYLHAGESATIALKLTVLGKAPGAPTPIQITYYEMSDPDPADRLFDHPGEITTDAAGNAELVIKALRPGVGLVRYLEAGADPAIKGFSGTFDFSCVRVLPADDYSAVPDDQLTWDFIFREIFEYYFCLYPTMDRFVKLNDEASVRAAGAAILARMDPTHSRRWDYMPRTRELSKGKRALFERWLSLT